MIAAVIALALLLAGCGIAYVLSLRQLELGTQTIPLPTDASQDGTAPTETEMQLTVFSLQGIEGTPNYQANQEWLAFTQSYTPSGGEYWDSDPAYWAYSVQDQTMVDKLDEICAKYGLKVIGKAWHEQVDCNKFLPLLGIDSLLKAGTDATLSIPAGRYFPGGSFTIYGTLNLGDAAEMFTYQCVKKDVFYDVFGYTNPDSRHREKLYHIGRRTPPVSGIGAERHDSGRPGGLLPEPEHHAGRKCQSRQKSPNASTLRFSHRRPTLPRRTRGSRLPMRKSSAHRTTRILAGVPRMPSM